MRRKNRNINGVVRPQIALFISLLTQRTAQNTDVKVKFLPRLSFYSPGPPFFMLPWANPSTCCLELSKFIKTHPLAPAQAAEAGHRTRRRRLSPQPSQKSPVTDATCLPLLLTACNLRKSFKRACERQSQPPTLAGRQGLRPDKARLQPMTTRVPLP